MWAGFRLLQMLPGIGPKTAGNILETSHRSRPRAAAGPCGNPSPAEDWRRLTSFVRLLTNLRKNGRRWPADIGQARLWYEPHLDRIHEDADTRKADLLQLEQIASGYPSRERFLTELTLDPTDATIDQAGVPLLDEDYLILSTIHSAKGQEWRAVFILNVVDGCIPSDLGTGTTEELEEERRLLLRCMTRARDHLALVTPQRFSPKGKTRKGPPRLCSPNAVHPGNAAAILRGDDLADGFRAKSERSAQQIRVDVAGVCAPCENRRRIEVQSLQCHHDA